MRRNLIIVLIIVLAIVAGFIFFTKDEVIFIKETSMYKAIPASTPVFIEISSLKSIPFDNPILEEILISESNILFLKNGLKLDSTIQNNGDIQKGIRNESFILAFDFVGEKEIFPLIVGKAESNNKQKAFEVFLNVLYPLNQYSYNEKGYSSHKVVSITSGSGTEVLYYSFTKGLLILSTKLLLVEQSLRQLDADSIIEDDFFAQANKTVTSQSDFSCYINHLTFHEIAAIWLNNRTEKILNEFGETIRLNYKNQFAGFKNLAAWTELDLKINKNELLLNGISVADDSLNHFLAIFDGQEPVRLDIDKILPKNTSFYTSYAFSNKSQFFQKLETYFSHTDSYYTREDQIKKMESGFRVDFKNTIQDIVKNEIAVAITVVPSDPHERSTLFFIQTEGGSKTEEQLSNLLDTYSKRKNIEPGSLKTRFEIDTETSFDIYEFPYPSFPGILFGKPFGIVEAKYAVLYDNYLVFSNSEKALQDYLHKMVLESMLIKDLDYQKFKQQWLNRANVNSYLNVNRAFTLNKEVFNKATSAKLKMLEEFIRNFNGVNWQIACENNICFNSVNIGFKQELEEEALTTWQSNLGSNVWSKPYLMPNHRDPGSLEIVVQDTENNLHQITKEGRVRWSVNIAGKIIGKIHQVDFYKNGRFQYLFNTKDKLYLIDRDANNVANFPVKFKSPATNGINVFDYENNKKYRYFVACEDKKVYAYNYDGKILTGWNFSGSDHPVTTPVEHYRVNNKDYIVFKDRSRIYILNRRGESRVTPDAKFENSGNPLVLNLNGKPKIVATDIKGKVYYLYFDGSFEVKDVGNFAKDHFFTVHDLDGNNIPDFVFIEGKQMKVVDEKGKKLFSNKFRNKIQNQPNIYSFSYGLKKVGIVESSANRIYLFEPSGQLHEGFPLQGNSEFSIGEMSSNSGVLNLIVGSKSGDLYNYSLN